jgi:hypothetical protein
VRQFIIFFAGFLLLLLLFTEEFARSLAWLRDLLKQNPRLRFIAYPLAIVLVILAAFLILNSLISLFGSAPFSYE